MSNGTDNFPKMPPYPEKSKVTTERAVSPAESVHDLSRLNRFDMCRAFGDTASYLGLCEDGDYVRVADVQALLAQPLQQEGGKIAAVLQNGSAVTNVYDAYQQGRTAGLEEAAQAIEPKVEHWAYGRNDYVRAQHADTIRNLAPQPSDNLQQVDEDQEFDRQAEAITAAILPPSELNPNATSVLDMFMSDIEPEASAPDAGPVCATCKGVGMVGGPVGQTPESFDYVSEDCPDCTPAKAAQNGGQDLRHDFEMWKSRRGEAAIYAGDGQYESSIVQGEWEAWCDSAELYRAAPPQQSDTSGLPG